MVIRYCKRAFYKIEAHIFACTIGIPIKIAWFNELFSNPDLSFAH